MFIKCPQCNTIPLLTLSPVTYTSISMNCLSCNHTSTLPITTCISELFNELNKPKNSIHHCQCSPSHSNQIANSFCLHCQQWICSSCEESHLNMKCLKNHLVRTTYVKLEINCEKHNRPIDYYCFDDNVYLCHECNKLHKNHSEVDLNEMLPNEKLEQINTEFLELKNKFEELNKKLRDDMVKKLTLKIEEVNKAYSRNKEINENICSFIDVIRGNAFDHINNYCIIKNMLVNTQLNKIKNIIIKDTSEKDVKELIDYYNTNFIISFEKGNNNENKEIVKIKKEDDIQIADIDSQEKYDAIEDTIETRMLNDLLF